jgi:hypothetical protein
MRSTERGYLVLGLLSLLLVAAPTRATLLLSDLNVLTSLKNVWGLLTLDLLNPCNNPGITCSGTILDINQRVTALYEF